MKASHPIELLAPAKDLECGYAAINSGADAVYIGAPRFGAREKAGNPISAITQLTEYAHLYWAKVYVVLNTLLYDHEVKDAVRLANQLYDRGVDALIIQDYGLLESDLPPIPLIASTQMHNHTPERVLFLENVGFQRAILARELSLNEIKAIRAQTQIELEVFVHGALCVSYSGQCYMSYAIGGRSANRGQCAQPCRRIYSLVDAKGNVLVHDRHLLSLKDMNRVTDLEDLLAAGVTSFKIEGRLKDKAYVTNVVGQYRQALDSLLSQHNLKASSSGTVKLDFIPDVNKTFNRGYTSYYLRERNILPGAIETPKMTGEPMGVVKDVRQRTVTISGDHQFVPGDGVCWFDSHNRLQGTFVNKVQWRKITLNQSKAIKIGMTLYRNHDHSFLTALMRSHPLREIEVKLSLDDTDTGFKLTAADTDHNLGIATLDMEKEKALKTAKVVATIKKQLTRMGGTPYRCDKVSIQCYFVPFIPIAQLNALRRNALQALTQDRLKNRPIFKQRKGSINISPYPETHLDYRHNVLNQYAERFYKRHGVKTTEPAAESGLDMHGKIVMRTRQCIKRQLGWCKDKLQTRYVNEQLYFVDTEGHRYPLVFDCKQCEMDILY